MLEVADSASGVAPRLSPLNRRVSNSKLATAADAHVPPKFKYVPPLNRSMLEGRMNARTLLRWRYLFSVAFPQGQTFPLANEKAMSKLTACDAGLGVGAGIMERVTAAMEREHPSRGHCIPFFVRETKRKEFDPEHPEEDLVTRVRRFICWTRQQNFYAAQQGYVAQLAGMQHASRFLQDLRFDATTTGDLTLSFYQHQLTKDQRAFVRFYDVDGNLYQMCRGLMGHSCFVEIQDIATRVIAGDPDYCMPQYSLQVPARRVWVDGVKMSGTAAQMQAAGKFIDDAAAAVGATWNADDRKTAVEAVTFIGGEWNHARRTIRCGAKVLARLDEQGRQCPESLSLQDLERLVAAWCTVPGSSGCRWRNIITP